MKKLLIPLFLLFAVGLNAQVKPMKGFFTPVNQVVRQDMKLLKAVNPDAKMLWLFRPSFSMTAVAFQFGGDKPLSKSLSSAGFGVSFGKFSTVSNEAYCYFSLNAAMLTQVNLSGSTSTSLGGSLTADVFNKFLGLGVGYLDKHFMLLTTISYSF
jgi:hypothetical protein